MVNMDLVPEDYRQVINIRRKVRHFIVACMMVLCIIGLAKALFSFLIWRENVKVVALEQQEQVAQQNKSKTEMSRQQKQVIEQQLAALAHLRGQDRLRLFLQAVDDAYSEGVWFDNLRFMRLSNANTLNPTNEGVNQGISKVPIVNENLSTLDINHGAEIIGHAINHSALAEFMRKLAAEKSVENLRLIDTGMRNYTNLQVVEFNLDLQVNKQKQQELITP
jgi:hypothetical protein